MPRASSLEAEIRKELDVETELVRGSGGIFDIIADGQTIFSKHETGVFPSADLIIAELRKRLG